ncbi:unnamed protein product [Paramecium sonneborni]|uniref:Uncharacterized protein n=1 Tax=Paramecium sonneborni TaxID=65129 RepID=A0A8S1LNW3_9CILI|nr:unnamed protein product [Paramecium sonneborni]
MVLYKEKKNMKILNNALGGNLQKQIFNICSQFFLFHRKQNLKEILTFKEPSESDCNILTERLKKNNLIYHRNYKEWNYFY